MRDCQSVDCQAADRACPYHGGAGDYRQKPAAAAGCARSVAGSACAHSIDRAYVVRVERGSENVTIATLEAMALALAARVTHLLVEPDSKAEPPTPAKAGRKPVR